MVQKLLKIELDQRSREYIAAIARPGNGLEKAQLFAGILKVMARSSSKIASAVTRNYLSGQTRRRRTGSLARSIVGDAEMYNGLPSFRVGILRGPALQYAGVQEEGTSDINPESPYGPIVPRNAKALAIPQKRVLTAAGVDKYGGPRNYPGNLRFVPFRGGRIAVGALYDEDELTGKKKPQAGRDAAGKFIRRDTTAEHRPLTLRDLRPAYILVRQVSLKPGHFLRRGMEDGMSGVESDLADFIDGIISGGSLPTSSIGPELSK